MRGEVEGFKDKTSWYYGLSAYWFATSAKWFILLLVVLPGQVQEIVPGGEKGRAWGMVFAIGAIWAMIGPALFGFISDRARGFFGRRQPYIAIGAASTCLALAFLADAHQLWVIVLGYLLLQVSDDLGTGPYSALIPEVVPEEHRGRASGVMGLLTLLGQLFIGVAGLAIGMAHLGIAAIYGTLAVLQILCAFWTLRTIRNVPAPTKSELKRASVSEFVKGWIEPWRNRDFFWVWFTRFLNAFGFYLVLNYLRFFLSDTLTNYHLFGADLGGSGNAANVLALTISLTGALGAAWASRAADRLGRKKVIYTGGYLMAVTLIPAVLSKDLTLIWALGLVFGLGYGMYLSADWALVSDVLPAKEDLAKDMGVWQMSNSAVQIFTGAAGALVDFGNRASKGLGYTYIFSVAAIAFLVSTFLVRQVRGSS